MNEPESALLRQRSTGMGLHGCMRSRLGADTSTGSRLILPYQLTNLVKQKSLLGEGRKKYPNRGATSTSSSAAYRSQSHPPDVQLRLWHG